MIPKYYGKDEDYKRRNEGRVKWTCVESSQPKIMTVKGDSIQANICNYSRKGMAFEAQAEQMVNNNYEILSGYLDHDRTSRIAFCKHSQQLPRQNSSPIQSYFSGFTYESDLTHPNDYSSSVMHSEDHLSDIRNLFSVFLEESINANIKNFNHGVPEANKFVEELKKEIRNITHSAVNSSFGRYAFVRFLNGNNAGYDRVNADYHLRELVRYCILALDKYSQSQSKPRQNDATACLAATFLAGGICYHHILRQPLFNNGATIIGVYAGEMLLKNQDFFPDKINFRQGERNRLLERLLEKNITMLQIHQKLAEYYCKHIHCTDIPDFSEQFEES